MRYLMKKKVDRFMYNTLSIIWQLKVRQPPKSCPKFNNNKKINLQNEINTKGQFYLPLGELNAWKISEHHSFGQESRDLILVR